MSLFVPGLSTLDATVIEGVGSLAAMLTTGSFIPRPG